MKPPYPSLTPTWHNSTYPGVDPSQPSLSAKGKTVVITGAGTGIGRATANAFLTAGASRIALIGRTSSTLAKTASELKIAITSSSPSPSCSVITYTVSITDGANLREAAAAIGPWHVLTLNAAYLSSPQEARTTDVTEWWQSFETNVKGALLTLQAFLPTANVISPRSTAEGNPDPASSTPPTILSLTTGAVSFPRDCTLTHSAYTSSKLAQICLFEFVAAENPDVMVVSVHPGMVATGMAEKAGMLDGRFERPMDDVLLPAHFLVWLTSPSARFLRGRVVWANWDVEELIKDDVRAKLERDESFLTAGVVGWDRLPFGPGRSAEREAPSSAEH